MEYWPDSLVTTERVFSMSAELDASTETPGMTAPEESLTVPTIEAWAWAMAGMTTSAARTRIAFTNLCIVTSKVLTALPGALFSSDEPAFPPLCGRGGSSAGSRQHLMKCFTSRWRLWGRRRTSGGIMQGFSPPWQTKKTQNARNDTFAGFSAR